MIVNTAEVFLLLNGLELAASDDEFEHLTRGVADGRLSKEDVTDFFKRFINESGELLS
jgi:prophage maintenance system killer protein